MSDANQVTTWREDFLMNVKVGVLLGLLGLATFYFFDAFFMRFLGATLLVCGAKYFQSASQIKKKR